MAVMKAIRNGLPINPYLAMLSEVPRLRSRVSNDDKHDLSNKTVTIIQMAALQTLKIDLSFSDRMKLAEIISGVSMFGRPVHDEETIQKLALTRSALNELIALCDRHNEERNRTFLNTIRLNAEALKRAYLVSVESTQQWEPQNPDFMIHLLPLASPRGFTLFDTTATSLGAPTRGSEQNAELPNITVTDARHSASNADTPGPRDASSNQNNTTASQGQSAQQPFGGLFSSGFTAQPPPSSFFGSGSTAQPPPSGLFGSGSTAQPPSSGLFGSGTTTQQPSSGLFGSGTTAHQQSSGLFGSGIHNQQPPTGLFSSGSGLFGTTPRSSGLFGASRTTSSPGQTQTTGLFGSSSAGQNDSQNSRPTSSGDAAPSSGPTFGNLSFPDQLTSSNPGISTSPFGGQRISSQTPTNGLFGSNFPNAAASQNATAGLSSSINGTNCFGTSGASGSSNANTPSQTSTLGNLVGTASSNNRLHHGLFSNPGSTSSNRPQGTSLFSPANASTISASNPSVFGAATTNTSAGGLFGAAESRSLQPGGLFGNRGNSCKFPT